MKRAHRHRTTAPMTDQTDIVGRLQRALDDKPSASRMDLTRKTVQAVVHEVAHLRGVTYCAHQALNTAADLLTEECEALIAGVKIIGAETGTSYSTDPADAPAIARIAEIEACVAQIAAALSSLPVPHAASAKEG